MHDETPDISIVVPVYNTERFLPACLESIDIQGTGSFEVILVDDGSTDGSPEICDAYCDKRERAFVIHKDNEGLLAARRDGLRKASGRYILSLDSDDALLEGCIKKVCDVIASTGADIISFDFTMGLIPIKPSLKVDICSGMHTGESFDAVKNLLCGCDFNSVWNKVIRRDLFASDEWYSKRVGLMHGEDLCQLLPVFDIAKSLFHIDEPLYYYRQHGANSTKQFKEDQITDWSFVSDELIRYASEWSSDSVKNAKRGICRHYCDLDEVLWHCEVDKEVKRQFDKTIKSEYQSRISNCPDLVHSLVLSNCSIVSFSARHLLSCFKCLRRLFV
ncbi:glycosyltransferase family 2 protein [Collinsella aerofaciens]|uniref:glycosyltransferase family 2 protein n=1 Tax=Collinsella aerofaciens TaxID=74426 RepID=UPI00232E3917|nr:glycosyltransferase family 2 protein [Collinsella aerofaciens]MDB1909329.1 glycosyltransferase family 2 protein [Collinsella aerofaciens]MDB1911227.1 glycosyltransferase family 2 protein [Collinsella aerofaciens]MDB1913113.1 glycosyltransferase family 2 protein [Collinsella aerofaciens]